MATRTALVSDLSGERDAATEKFGSRACQAFIDAHAEAVS